MSNYYTLLGLEQGATADQIRKAYRDMARKYHPDRNPGDNEAEATFKKVQEAYETLSDPVKRGPYDFKLPKKKPVTKAAKPAWERPPSQMSVADAPPPAVDLWGEPVNKRPDHVFRDTFGGRYESGSQPSIR